MRITSDARWPKDGASNEDGADVERVHKCTSSLQDSRSVAVECKTDRGLEEVAEIWRLMRKHSTKSV